VIANLVALIGRLQKRFLPNAIKSFFTNSDVPRQRYEYLVDIRRFDGDADLPALAWTSCHPSTMSRFKAQMTCSNGHGLVLKAHSVDATGRVHPSVVCMTMGCGFHEYVRLVDWNFGSLK
jgi:hypothetical protein